MRGLYFPDQFWPTKISFIFPQIEKKSLNFPNMKRLLQLHLFNIQSRCLEQRIRHVLNAILAWLCSTKTYDHCPSNHLHFLWSELFHVRKPNLHSSRRSISSNTIIKVKFWFTNLNKLGQAPPMLGYG